MNDFLCPKCKGHQRVGDHIIFKEKSFVVYFSQVAGEHSTYETDGDSVHMEGEDAGRYTYFKIGEKFKKYF